MYDSDTICLNACLLTLLILLYIYLILNYIVFEMSWINTFWVWVFVDGQTDRETLLGQGVKINNNNDDDDDDDD